MTERIVTETYSRETRRLYDQSDRSHVYDSQVAQLHQLTDIVYSLVRELRKGKEKKAPVLQEQKISTPEIDDLKKAIADLTEKVERIQENSEKFKQATVEAKKEKKEQKVNQFAEILEAQQLIKEQLDEHRVLLTKIDHDRQESDRVLRDDVSEALTEHKHLTDEAIHELAIKVSDLISDTSRLRSMVDDVKKTLEALYVEEAVEEAKVPRESGSGRSSVSSGSIAVELPPAIITDGRRPSQAYHMHTLVPTEELADITAKKALEEATRISVSRL